MLNIFKPITDITKQVSGLLQGARGFMDKVGEGGLRGIARDAFDFNAEGFTEEADKRIAQIILHLTMAGNQESIETVLRFRSCAVATIEELQLVNQISANYWSDDPEELELLVSAMQGFLETKGPGMVYSEREEALRLEMARLRKMTGQLESFLRGEGPRLEREDGAGGNYPTIDTMKNSSVTRYPVAGSSRKKPLPKIEIEAE